VVPMISWVQWSYNSKLGGGGCFCSWGDRENFCGGVVGCGGLVIWMGGWGGGGGLYWSCGIEYDYVWEKIAYLL